MATLIAPEGDYRLTAKTENDLQSGAWYYGWKCASCGKSFAVFDDKSGGKNPVPVLGPGMAVVACPLCKVENKRSMEEMIHFKWTA